MRQYQKLSPDNSIKKRLESLAGYEITGRTISVAQFLGNHGDKLPDGDYEKIVAVLNYTVSPTESLTPNLPGQDQKAGAIDAINRFKFLVADTSADSNIHVPIVDQAVATWSAAQRTPNTSELDGVVQDWTKNRHINPKLGG